MIIADENDVGGIQGAAQMLTAEYGFVAAECLVELAEIFAAVVRILHADFAFDSCQRVKLRRAAARTKICGRGHFSAASYQLLAFHLVAFVNLDFLTAASLCS